MEKLFEIALYALFAGLLLGAAVSDARSRRIPFRIGLGLLLLAAALLVIQGYYFEAVFLVLAVIGSRGGWWSLAVWSFAIVFLAEAGEERALPMVVGILFFHLMFATRRLGGGDAQVAYALVGIAHDWAILALVLGATIVAGLILVWRKYGLIGGLARLASVTRHLGADTSQDPKAIRSPWAVWAAIGGMLYLFAWPGWVPSLVVSALR